MVYCDNGISQSANIYTRTDGLFGKKLRLLGLEKHCIHTGPMIRKEGEYSEMSCFERRKIFNKMVTFLRQSGVNHKSLYIEKKNIEDIVEASKI